MKKLPNKRPNSFGSLVKQIRESSLSAPAPATGSFCESYYDEQNARKSEVGNRS